MKISFTKMYMTTTYCSTECIFQKVVKCKYLRNYSFYEQPKIRFGISDLDFMNNLNFINIRQMVRTFYLETAVFQEFFNFRIELFLNCHLTPLKILSRGPPMCMG